MNNFAINLLGANGQIHSFAVPATVLTQVYQTLMESDECEIIPPLSIPTVQPIPQQMQQYQAPKPAEPVYIPGEVQNGTRPGYCEIYFTDKPETEQRSELRSAGFRPSKAGGRWHWYGLVSRLPARYDAPSGGLSQPEPEPTPEPSAPSGETFNKPVNLVDLVNSLI